MGIGTAENDRAEMELEKSDEHPFHESRVVADEEDELQLRGHYCPFGSTPPPVRWRTRRERE
jgi:hypothetical protein